MGLGATTEIDTSDAEILLDETIGVVTLRVDQQAVKYDLAARSLAPSD
jgi:hypothetical protein